MAYQNKLSGPILDRIDIHYGMSPQSKALILAKQETHDRTTLALRNRISKACEFSHTRNQQFQCTWNSDLPLQGLSEALRAKECDRKEIETILERVVSTRRATRLLRLARTLADLDFKDSVSVEHVEKCLILSSEMQKYGSRDQPLSQKMKWKAAESHSVN